MITVYSEAGENMQIGIKDRIDLMVEQRDVPRLQALAHDPDKATAKYARKGLHILRTRGVDAPVPRKGGPRIEPVMLWPDGRIAAAADLPLLAAIPGLMRRRRRKVVDP